MKSTGLTEAGYRFGWRANRHAVLTYVATTAGNISTAQVVSHHRSSRTTRRYLDAPLSTDMEIANLFCPDLL